MNANSNEDLSNTETLVEGMLDDLLVEAELNVSDGPLDPHLVLIEMAARALCRAILDYKLQIPVAYWCARGRMSLIMEEALGRSQAKLPPGFHEVRN